MADELIDILNEKGVLTGEVQLKSKAHENGLWHASAQIWIFNNKGEVLLQKRAVNKDTYPGLWDISVAGHLSAGDTPKQAAVREIEEEIGVSVAEKELIFLKKIKKQKRPNATIIDNEFNSLFLLNYDVEVSKLKLQDAEVESVKLISIARFEKELIQSNTSFVPHGLAYYQYILSEIRKRI